jgi:hypothetical protein
VGLVLVDHCCVPTGSCDVTLALAAAPAVLRGAVAFLHPLHNFGLLSFATADLPPGAREALE